MPYTRRIRTPARRFAPFAQLTKSLCRIERLPAGERVRLLLKLPQLRLRALNTFVRSTLDETALARSQKSLHSALGIERAYASYAGAIQTDVQFMEARGHHHYSILDSFDERSTLGAAVKSQMGLT
jgi:hypothetical protein